MKKDVLNKIPALKNKNGKLYGGFSTLSIEQTEKIKGGANISDCGNRKSCGNKICHDNNYCGVVPDISTLEIK